MERKTSDSFRSAGRTDVSRRALLRGLGAAAALGAIADPALTAPARAEPLAPLQPNRRRSEAYRIRLDAARTARDRRVAKQRDNGDEARYPDRIGSYSKGLPHDANGVVLPSADAAMRRALGSGDPDDFEAIPLGDARPLTNPQAGLAFDLVGTDSQQLWLPPAPALASAEAAGEMTELYWMALARDVPFADYELDPRIAEAAEDLSRLAAFRGPSEGGVVTPRTIFRGGTPGDLVGPYLSQFLWLDIPMGALAIPQKVRTVPPGADFLTGWDEWLAIQNGVEAGDYALDPTPRYIRDLRDLAEWVHVDALFQAYHQACLVLLGMDAPPDPGNPYASSANQAGFGTFGGPHILSLVTGVASCALQVVWFQKWFVHRRLRPEAYGGLVHRVMHGASLPLHEQILSSPALAHVHDANGTFLLPVAAPEGSPTHPSYGAGHATVAGACVTLLKAWFDESFVIPEPRVADASGDTLLAYHGPALTVGNELDKLAANVAIGRNALGVHYRSDYWESLRLGEELALAVLEERKACYNEPFTLSLTRFDGSRVTV